MCFCLCGCRCCCSAFVVVLINRKKIGEKLDGNSLRLRLQRFCENNNIRQPAVLALAKRRQQKNQVKKTTKLRGEEEEEEGAAAAASKHRHTHTDGVRKGNNTKATKATTSASAVFRKPGLPNRFFNRYF